MQKISAYILTYNEAEKIEAAVSSLLWADEVVVVDSFSTDRTAEVARSLGARVVNVPFRGFGDLRNRAITGIRISASPSSSTKAVFATRSSRSTRDSKCLTRGR